MNATTPEISKVLEELDKEIQEEEICPVCGLSEYLWKNSSDMLRCDNCGYEEEDEEPEGY